MDCDQFGKRMHRCLDNRMSPDGDRELFRHAQSCDACRVQLDAWRQISSIIPEAKGGYSGSRRKVAAARGTAAVVGLAAAMLLVVTALRHQSGMESPTVDSGVADPHQTVLAQSGGDLDPKGWWRSVKDRDWVDQTMPAVRSVQKGVAPLGRSLLRAVTILTTGGRDRTS